MEDLTQGSIIKHLLHLSAFLAASMLGQTLYLIVDLYWIGHLGKEPIAAVGIAGNLTMVVLAVTLVLSVGTTTLISQSTGEKNQARAEAIFNQSFALSLLLALMVGVCGFLLRAPYCELLSADAATATLAKSYLLWFIPALLLQFPLVSLASALRSTGVVKPAVGLQLLGVAFNIVLAPLLIFGIGPWPRLGVTGAALASFISILIADALMVAYFEKRYHYLRFRFQSMRPQTEIWSKILRIGVPAGGEFVLTFFYFTTVYGVIRNFGPAAQAGFGVGARAVQALLLPVAALSFAVAPLVGQNFGGRRSDRVRKSVYSAIVLASIMMIMPTLIAYFAPAALIRVFSSDPRVIAFGSDYLRVASLVFVPAGIVFCTASVFQGFGHTWPPFFSSATRLVLFVLPATVLSRMPRFEIKYVWYLQVASVALQAIFNLLLLRRELRIKLTFGRPGGVILPKIEKRLRIAN